METLLAAGLVLSAAGTGYNIYAQQKAARKEEKALEEQARQEREAATTEAQNVREKGRRLLASQRASLAASGVKLDEGGTGEALQQETRTLTERDALAVLKGGGNRASLLTARADMAGDRGTAAAISGGLNFAADAVNTVGASNRATAPTRQATNIYTQAESATKGAASKYSLLTGKYSLNG
jgi:hypothetical protein